MLVLLIGTTSFTHPKDKSMKQRIDTIIDEAINQAKNEAFLKPNLKPQQKFVLGYSWTKVFAAGAPNGFQWQINNNVLVLPYKRLKLLSVTCVGVFTGTGIGNANACSPMLVRIYNGSFVGNAPLCDSLFPPGIALSDGSVLNKLQEVAVICEGSGGGGGDMAVKTQPFLFGGTDFVLFVNALSAFVIGDSITVDLSFEFEVLEQ